MFSHWLFLILWCSGLLPLWCKCIYNKVEVFRQIPICIRFPLVLTVLCRSLTLVLVIWLHIEVCYSCEAHAGVIMGVYGCICVLTLKHAPVLRYILWYLCITTLVLCHSIRCHPSQLRTHIILWCCISSDMHVIVRRIGLKSWWRRVRTWLGAIFVFKFLVCGEIGSILLVLIDQLVDCWLWCLLSEYHTFPGGYHSTHNHCVRMCAGCIIPWFHLVSVLLLCKSILCVPLALPNSFFNVSSRESYLCRWHQNVEK